MLDLIKIKPSVLKDFIPEYYKLTNNRDFMLELVKINKNAYNYIGSNLKKDRDFMLELVKINESVLKEDFLKKLKEDDIFKLDAIKNNCLALQYFDLNNENKKKILLEILDSPNITKCIELLDYETFLKEFILELLTNYKNMDKINLYDLKNIDFENIGRIINLLSYDILNKFMLYLLENVNNYILKEFIDLLEYNNFITTINNIGPGLDNIKRQKLKEILLSIDKNKQDFLNKKLQLLERNEEKKLQLLKRNEEKKLQLLKRNEELYKSLDSHFKLLKTNKQKYLKYKNKYLMLKHKLFNNKIFIK